MCTKDYSKLFLETRNIANSTNRKIIKVSENARKCNQRHIGLIV